MVRMLQFAAINVNLKIRISKIIKIFFKKLITVQKIASYFLLLELHNNVLICSSLHLLYIHIYCIINSHHIVFLFFVSNLQTHLNPKFRSILKFTGFQLYFYFLCSFLKTTLYFFSYYSFSLSFYIANFYLTAVIVSCT